MYTYVVATSKWTNVRVPKCKFEKKNKWKVDKVTSHRFWLLAAATK